MTRNAPHAETKLLTHTVACSDLKREIPKQSKRTACSALESVCVCVFPGDGSALVSVARSWSDTLDSIEVLKAMTSANPKVSAKASSSANGESRYHPAYHMNRRPLETALTSPDWAADLQFDWPESPDAATTASSEWRQCSSFCAAALLR